MREACLLRFRPILMTTLAAVLGALPLASASARRRAAPAARHRDHRRPDRQPGADALHDAGGLPLPRPLPPPRPRDARAGWRARDGRAWRRRHDGSSRHRSVALLDAVRLRHGRARLPAPAAGDAADARVQGDQRFATSARPCRATRSTAASGGRMYGDPVLDRLAAQVDVSNQNLKEAEAAYRQAVALVRQSQRRSSRRIGYTGSAAPRAAAAPAAAAARSSVVARRRQLDDQYQRRRHADLGDRHLGPHPPHRSRAIRRPPRRAPPTSLTRGCRRRRAWPPTISRCASPTSASAARGSRWRPSRARCRSCRTSSTPAPSRSVDVAQAQTQLDQTRAQLVAEGINRAQFEHAIAVLIGKAPAEFSLAPEPAAQGRADRRCRHAVGAARAAARHRLGRAADGRRPTRRSASRWRPTIPTSRSPRASTSPAPCSPTCCRSPTRCGRSGRSSPAPLIDGGARAAQVEGARANYDATGRDLPPDRAHRLPAGRGCARPAAHPASSRRACSAPRVAAARKAEQLVAQPVPRRHGALHDGGHDPDRRAQRRADACSASA